MQRAVPDPVTRKTVTKTISTDDIASVESPVEDFTRPMTGYQWGAASNDTGRGALNLVNGTTKDGVAVLFERAKDNSVQPRRAVYIRSRESTRLADITPSAYTLRFMLGSLWNESDRAFRDGVECYALVDELEFNEKKTDDGIEYSEQSVTLHKVINGNARLTTVSQAMVKFDELVRAQQP